jgi:hypothetical protein
MSIECVSEPILVPSNCDLTRPGRWQDRGNTLTTNASGGTLVYGGETIPFSGTASPTEFKGTYPPTGRGYFASGTMTLTLKGCTLTLGTVNTSGGSVVGGVFNP